MRDFLVDLLQTRRRPGQKARFAIFASRYIIYLSVWQDNPASGMVGLSRGGRRTASALTGWSHGEVITLRGDQALQYAMHGSDGGFRRHFKPATPKLRHRLEYISTSIGCGVLR